MLVDGEIFESKKKKLRIQKYPDTYASKITVVESSTFFRSSSVPLGICSPALLG